MNLTEEIEFLKTVEEIDFYESAKRKAEVFYKSALIESGVDEALTNEHWYKNEVRIKDRICSDDWFAQCVHRAFEYIDNKQLLKEIGNDYHKEGYNKR